MNPSQGPTSERVEFPGTDERITPEQWQHQTEEIRAMLVADGMSEADVAEDLRIAFGEITFVDDSHISWRHDGGVWWRWTSSAWEQSTPPGGLRVDRAVFELDPEPDSDPELEQLLAGAEGLAGDYERFIAEHPDATWPEVPDEHELVPSDPVDDTRRLPGAAPPGFRATHVVPAAGMSTWAEPGDAQPGPSLDPGLNVQQLETWGDWAHITCDNGWTAWVDGRDLVSRGAGTEHGRSVAAPRSTAAPVAPVESVAAPSQPGQRFVTPSKRTWPVSTGAAAVALGGLLPWFDLGPGVPTQSAFDGAIKYLVDYENPGTGLRIGLVLLLVAGCAFVARHMRGWEKAVRPLAMVGVAICVLFVVQTQRLLSAATDLGGDAPGVIDVVGVGVWISLAGGALLAWGGSRK